MKRPSEIGIGRYANYLSVSALVSANKENQFIGDYQYLSDMKTGNSVAHYSSPYFFKNCKHIQTYEMKTISYGH